MSKPLKVRHITLMEPVESRHVSHVVHAMDVVLNRMRVYGGLVSKDFIRNRAKELLARRFKSWISQKGLVQTYTAGDDPQSNGHCESEVNQLKRRTRLLLHMAQQENTSWPQAMRYAAEERLSEPNEQFGMSYTKNGPLQFRCFGQEEKVA